MAVDNWNREQLIVALNLYWKIPYNKISGSSNSLIKEYAPIIGRSSGAIAYKLMNFTSLDTEKQKIGNKGKSAASAADEEIWNEYLGNWEKLAHDSLAILSKIKEKPIEDILELEPELKFVEGKEKERLVKTRVNQNDFRERILGSYNEKCCITGISIKTLLVASHIIPWSENVKERLNPRNGLCLNSFHDKAFDKGLLTITNDFKIKLSKDILKKKNDEVIKSYFIKYENQQIILPDRYKPSIDFLDWHQKNRFEK